MTPARDPKQGSKEYRRQPRDPESDPKETQKDPANTQKVLTCPPPYSLVPPRTQPERETKTFIFHRFYKVFRK